MIICVLILGFSSYIFSDDMNKKEDTEYEWGPESENYQLSIQAGKKVYTYCEPIILKIRLKNVGKQKVELVKTHPNRSFFTAIVKYEKEDDVVLTALGKILRDSLWGPKEYIVELEPDQTDESYLLVNRIHDMTRRGEYSITVKCYVYKRNGKGSAEVGSNTIKVEVKGDPPNPFEDSKSE